MYCGGWANSECFLFLLLLLNSQLWMLCDICYIAAATLLSFTKLKIFVWFPGAALLSNILNSHSETSKRHPSSAKHVSSTNRRQTIPSMHVSLFPFPCALSQSESSSFCLYMYYKNLRCSYSTAICQYLWKSSVWYTMQSRHQYVMFRAFISADTILFFSKACNGTCFIKRSGNKVQPVLPTAMCHS